MFDDGFVQPQPKNDILPNEKIFQKLFQKWVLTKSYEKKMLRK